MRTFKRAVAGAITTALAIGLVSAPALSADAATRSAAKSTHGVSVKLTVSDLTNKPGKYTVKRWAKVTVRVPAPFQDTFSDGSKNGTPKPVTYSVVLTSTGAQTCGGKAGRTVAWKYGLTKSTTLTIPVTFKNTKSGLIRYYTLSGKCKLSAKVTAYRYTVNKAGTIDNVKATAAATYYVRTSTSLTKPSASASHVKKNHTVKLSGKATYLRADSKHWYTKTKLPKGTKLVVQKKAKGAKSWSKVATVKVTSKGTWSKSVKVAKTASYRVVYAGSSTRNAKTSAVRVVKVG